jgi:hypothetical protein
MHILGLNIDNYSLCLFKVKEYCKGEYSVVSVAVWVNVLACNDQRRRSSGPASFFWSNLPDLWSGRFLRLKNMIPVSLSIKKKKSEISLAYIPNYRICESKQSTSDYLIIGSRLQRSHSRLSYERRLPKCSFGIYLKFEQV